MNDDPFLDLFAFDLPDLTSCAPDLSLALALYLPDPSEAIPLFPCPPIAGAAPAWWDVIADFFRGIWGGAGDLAEKIGKSFSALWDKIWSWVGGAIRWLYNWAAGIVDWLGRQLLAYFNWVGGFINTTASWLRNTIGNSIDRVQAWVNSARDWVWGRVKDAWDAIGRQVQSTADWLWGVVRGRIDQVQGWVSSARDWLWGRVKDAWDAIGRQIQSTADWLWKQVKNAWDIIGRQITDTASWLKDSILPPIMGGIGDLAGGIGNAFGKVGDLLGNALGTLGETLSDAIRWPWEHIFEPYTDVVERKLAIPGKLIRGQYASLLDLVDDVVDPAPIILAGIAGAIILSLVISMVTAGIMAILVQPLCEPHVQASRARVGAQLLTVGVLQDALNRGFIDERTAEDHLSRSGYDGTSRTALLQLRNILPGPTDLVHMAVREVFDPEARQRLTLDLDFPEPFAQYAALLGITREWAENHWAAHWDLPSPSQGYEMLHRGLITEQDLANLLKALDYAPVWRDKLQAISYSPITRVDLRRLYKLKILTEDDVFTGYKALGYDEQRARWLTDFTKNYYTPEDESEVDEFTKASAAQIRLAYRRHVITRDEAVDKLMELGYSEDTADFLLALDDVQLALNPTTDSGIPVRDLTVSIIRTAYAEKLWTRERAQEELELLGYLAWEADLLLQLEDLAQQRELTGLAETVVKELYLANAIDEAEAAHQLDELEVLPERRDLLLQRWQLQKAQKPKRLTLAQVQRAYREGIFTQAEFLDELSVQGYNDRDAGIILAIT